MSTNATVRDSEALRQAVGDPKLTYSGTSYGTRIGYVYAHAYPNEVRAMLLTSPVDPNATWSSSSFQSALAPGTAIGLAFEAFPFNNWHTPLLIMGSTRDSLTPYGWAADMARTFRNSRVITYVGSTHTPFLAGSTCIDRYGIDYLIGLRRPRVDAACPNTLMDPGRPPHRRVAATFGIL